MSDANPPQPERWHVGKEVPLAIMLSLVVQTSALIWWARGQVAAVEDHERRLATLEKDRDVVRVAERIAVIEAAIVEIRRSNERLEQLLGGAFQNGRPRLGERQ